MPTSRASAPVLALALGAAGVAGAQEAPVALGCSVSGYDVVLRNLGPDPLPAGTLLDWAVPFARVTGSHVLTSDLAPQAMVYMTAALGANYLRPTTPCEAVVAPPPAATGG